MILTPDQRLRVFVSSTLAELAPERAVVREVIERMRLAPVMFELGARPHPPRALYRAYLEQSHVFVAIYGERYGWVAPTMDISGLEDEYRLSGDRPKLVYVKEPAPEREARLTTMLDGVAADPRVTLRLYGSIDELAALVADDLARVLAEPFTQPARGRIDVGEAGAAAGATGMTSTLPVAPTPMIGRAGEFAAVTDLLRRDDVRLVTVTGIGGIGKSRLGLEVARACVGDFRGGVVLVDLADVPELGLVLTSIASELGVHLDSHKPSLDVVADAVADRGRTLVFLDNAEQIRDAADEIAALVVTCPSLTLLVTSRKRLRLAAEHDCPLPPLDVGSVIDPGGFGSMADGELRAETDAAQCDAVRLFVERARAARPDLDIDGDPEQLAATITICQRLDGIPLAIELAAARVRLLPPVQLLARFDRPLDLPSARLADLPERQRTLRATLDWSRDLLDEPHQDLLAQLSVFAGGACLDAVTRVCAFDGELLDALATLADQSLLEVELSVVDAPRFRMLSTVREYARDLLRESGRQAEVDAAHIAWVRHLADGAHAALRGADFVEWVERLEMESGNIRQAGTRAYAAGDPEALADTGFKLWIWLWTGHHTREARLWLERALGHPGLHDPLVRARLHWTMAGAAFEQGDRDLSRQHLAEAETLFAELDDLEGRAVCLFLRASLAPAVEGNDVAVATFIECEAVSLQAGIVFLASVCASVSGVLLVQGGKVDEGAAALDRGLALAESIGNPMLRAQATVNRGVGRLGTGDVDSAAADLVAGAELARAAKSAELLSYSCEGLAAVALMRGQANADAAALIGAAHGMRERAGIVPWPALAPAGEMVAEAIRTEVPDFDEGAARGRPLGLDAVVELARLVAAGSTAA